MVYRKSMMANRRAEPVYTKVLSCQRTATAFRTRAPSACPPPGPAQRDPLARTTRALIGAFGEHRVDRAAPAAIEIFQELLGSGLAARDDLVERLEVDRLVAATGEPAPAG